MSNIFHQSVEDILKAATPEQKILWNDIFLRLGERCAVSQLVYRGILSSAEFYAFTARRAYLAYQWIIGHSGPTSAIPDVVTIFNENNVQCLTVKNTCLAWDATAAAMVYALNTVKMTNLLFGRLSAGTYNYTSFIGYRITY